MLYWGKGLLALLPTYEGKFFQKMLFNLVHSFYHTDEFSFQMPGKKALLV